MIVPVILAGGSGTRLWPLSRGLYPKQLLPLAEEKTMLQATALRAAAIDQAHPPIVLCNEEHRFMVAEQLRDLGIQPSAIILEPEGRNTAPAAAVAAFFAQRNISDDPLLLVLPADHVIQNESAFLGAVQAGGFFARQGRCLTFGVVPRSPETGYGYIERGDRLTLTPTDGQELEAFQIKRFVEKPDRETAKGYVDSGQFFWNSGMFLFQTAAYLKELERFSPEIMISCRKACSHFEQDLDFFRVDQAAFASCPSDSIDYAVMEKTDKGIVIPFYAGWSDVGSWDALWEVRDKDKTGNVVSGDVLVQDVQDSYVQATSRLVAVCGVTGMVVVETPDAVLVCPKDKVQGVKRLVAELNAGHRSETQWHSKVFRPWGAYETIEQADRFQVKRITVNPGAKLSLQKHFHRAEHWVVVSGTAVVQRGDERIVLKEDQSTYIPLGMFHRLENPGRIPLELIEVQSGTYLGEDDIVRFDDDYGRGEGSE